MVLSLYVLHYLRDMQSNEQAKSVYAGRFMPIADYVAIWAYSGVEAYYKYGYDKVDVDKEEFISRYKMLPDRHFSFDNMLLSAYSKLPDKYIEEYLPSRTVKVPGTDYEYVIAPTEE